MRVLVTGARGLLGAAIVEAFSGSATVEAADHAALDIADSDAVERAFARFRPTVVINCAAYNDVDRAEEDAHAALRVNAIALQGLGRTARVNGVTLVHYSTDFVFDGETNQPYAETDPPNPRSVYAASKLLGDWFAAAAPRHYVLRVESLFGGPAARNGPRRGSLGILVNRIMAGDEVPVFVDRVVSPSYAPDVAQATKQLLERNAPFGIYNCVNSGFATWAEIAGEAARLLGRTPRLRALTLETASLKAPRPRFCALSNRRLASLGVVLPPWQDALARFIVNQLAS
jgi:dTDP-4-dehydrorhamnose reductase